MSKYSKTHVVKQSGEGSMHGEQKKLRNTSIFDVLDHILATMLGFRKVHGHKPKAVLMSQAKYDLFENHYVGRHRYTKEQVAQMKPHGVTIRVEPESLPHPTDMVGVF